MPIENKYSRCQKCPAFHLLSSDRKQQVERWEYKRHNYVKRMKKVRLLLLGESIPANRYFYDVNSDYNGQGLRYTLKKEFNKLDLSDEMFLESIVRKGIILYDCALCPLHRIEDKSIRQEAATYCFLTINIQHLFNYPTTPFVTIFPANLGFLRTKIPSEIMEREIGRYSFTDQAGLNQRYEEVKSLNE
jgi:hypothetical protein